MADFAYGLANWAWIGLKYAAKSYSAAYSKGVAASQQYQGKRSKTAAWENPIAYSCHADDLTEYDYRSMRPKVIHPNPGSGAWTRRGACTLFARG